MVPAIGQRERRVKKGKRQRGFTLVETIVASTLLLMLIGIFGSIMILTLRLSLREEEASQAEILADMLAKRIDEILRDAQYVSVNADGTEIVFSSPKYPADCEKASDAGDGEPPVEMRAALHIPGGADTESPEISGKDRESAGTLRIRYAGRAYPLLPDAGYGHMTAGLSVVSAIPADGVLRGSVRLRITLRGTGRPLSFRRDFTVLLPNCG